MPKLEVHLGSSVTPFDSDQNYRGRLASVVLGVLSDLRTSRDALRKEIAALLESKANVTESKPIELPTSSGAWVEALSPWLKRHPDVQSRLAVLTQYTTSKWLLEQELESRGVFDHKEIGNDPYETAKRARAVGICLSGGGIRSATFNLGVLQGLAPRSQVSEYRLSLYRFRRGLYPPVSGVVDLQGGYG